MSQNSDTSTVLKVVDLAQNQPTPFLVVPDSESLANLRDQLDLIALRKLRLEGQLTPDGDKDWLLTAKLGATVVQPCVATLDPVTTRIETPVRRIYLATYEDVDEPEAEMPEHDESEPLGPEIDLALVMAEALSLALPQYPRADNTEAVELRVTEPGKTPMSDDDAKPFAGLANLRDALSDKDA